MSGEADVVLGQVEIEGIRKEAQSLSRRVNVERAVTIASGEKYPECGTLPR
jgi:hypothetical protein